MMYRTCSNTLGSPARSGTGCGVRLGRAGRAAILSKGYRKFACAAAVALFNLRPESTGVSEREPYHCLELKPFPCPLFGGAFCLDCATEMMFATSIMFRRAS